MKLNIVTNRAWNKDRKELGEGVYKKYICDHCKKLEAEFIKEVKGGFKFFCINCARWFVRENKKDEK